jgi:hypothetical protein
MLDFTDKQKAEMFALEQQLALVLQRANAQKVEAAVAAFACVRCARILLNLYPEAARGVLVDETVIPFLKNEQAPAADAPLIVIPGWVH